MSKGERFGIKCLRLMTAAGFVLSACGQDQVSSTPQVEGLCGSPNMFELGETVMLGENEDYAALLAVNKSEVLRSYALILVLPDGLEFSPHGGTLPELGVTDSAAWEPYVQVDIANCPDGYHYSVIHLDGAEARVVTDWKCVPEDYKKDGLKPWPFASGEKIWIKDDEEVSLVSTSEREMYLFRYRGETLSTQIAVERPGKGEISYSFITTNGGIIFVRVINCEGNYFYRTEYFEWLQTDSRG